MTFDQRGLHVLMEKPMTTDVDEARDLAAAAAAAAARDGRAFLVNNTANYRAQVVCSRRRQRVRRVVIIARDSTS